MTNTIKHVAQIKPMINFCIALSLSICMAFKVRKYDKLLCCLGRNVQIIFLLSNNILDLEKIKAWQVEVDFAPFNVRPLVGSTMRMLAIRAHERKWICNGEWTM